MLGELSVKLVFLFLNIFEIKHTQNKTKKTLKKVFISVSIIPTSIFHSGYYSSIFHFS